MKDPLTPYELDRLEAARLNSVPLRQESPNKRVTQLAFEEIEYLRAEGMERLDKLAQEVASVREFLRRACRVERPGETETDMRE
jgi:hypothetical protein